MEKMTHAKAKELFRSWIEFLSEAKDNKEDTFIHWLAHVKLIELIEPPTLLEVWTRVKKLLALGHNIDDELLARFIEALAREEAKDD